MWQNKDGLEVRICTLNTAVNWRLTWRENWLINACVDIGGVLAVNRFKPGAP